MVIFKTNIKTDLKFKFIFEINIRINPESIFIFKTNIKLALEYILIRANIGIRLEIRAISKRKIIGIIGYIINIF
jgi:hypothetical protein